MFDSFGAVTISWLEQYKLDWYWAGMIDTHILLMKVMYWNVTEVMMYTERNGTFTIPAEHSDLVDRADDYCQTQFPSREKVITIRAL